MSLPVSHAGTTEDELLVHHFDRVLLSPDHNSSESPPLALLHKTSAYLHDRLNSRFEPSKWPLVQLRRILDDVLDRFTQLPVLQLAAAPSSPTSTPLSATLALKESPRASRAKNCVRQLAQVPGWVYLLEDHNYIVSRHKRGRSPEYQSLANDLIHDKFKFSAIMPELTKLSNDPNVLVESITNAYHELMPRVANFTAHEALAFVLVHLVSSVSPQSQDPEVLATNSHLAGQFGRQYRGDAPIRFLNFVVQLDQAFDCLGTSEPKPYFRGTPIVQSSGTGKTRMVLELRHYAPLLYVCFRKRDADANAKAGFPFPDYGVRKYFEMAERSHPSSYDLHVACFLAAWFSELAKDLRDLVNIRQKHIRLLDLHRFDLHQGQNPLRTHLFQNTVELADTLLSKELKTETPPSWKSIFDRFLVQPVLDLNEQLVDVSDYLHSLHPNAPVPPVLVAFDECVEMNVSGRMMGETQLNSLRRAWNYIGQVKDKHKTLRFWLVLMSTSSSAAHLVEHASVQSSIRRMEGGPLPTFVGVGFDVLSQEQPSLSSASEASRLEHIIKYGRPLWSSLEMSNFWDNAVMKLSGGVAFSEDRPAQCFSVLASRLALRLVPVHAADLSLLGQQKIFTDSSVDRHMRIVSRVTDEATLFVDSPSEPVLAIAASLIMLPTAGEERRHQIANWQSAVNTYGSILEYFRKNCLLSSSVPLLKGTHGELVARVILTVAWDAEKRKAFDDMESARRKGSKGPPPLNDYASELSRPVLLDNILTGLAQLDDKDCATLRKSVQDICSLVSARCHPYQTPGQPAHVQAWTNYTHFDMLPEAITQISPEYLWNCWKRGVALQMAHLQDGIDGIIPVFVGDLAHAFVASGEGSAESMAVEDRDELQAARHMTYIAWEAKNRRDPQPSVQKGSEQLMPKFSGPQLMRARRAATGETPLTPRALLTVLLDVGTVAAFSNTRNQRPRLERILGTECDRLCIRGVSDKHAYPCLDRLKIREIIGELVNDVVDQPSYEQFNTMPNPVWNDTARPNLQLVTRAFASETDVLMRDEQNMDVE